MPKMPCRTRHPKSLLHAREQARLVFSYNGLEALKGQGGLRSGVCIVDGDAADTAGKVEGHEVGDKAQADGDVGAGRQVGR